MCLDKIYTICLRAEQRRAEIAAHPFAFLIFALLTCLMLFVVTLPCFPGSNMLAYVSRNYRWTLLSGVGFYLTFIGFYFLFTRFGASYYVLSAVLSILTTSILVGVLLFQEAFNFYYGLSVLCAIAAIVLFSLGQKSVPRP